MLSHRSVRVRVIGLVIATLLGVLYFWTHPAAQPIESMGPDFKIKQASAENDSYIDIYRVLHLRTGECWLMTGGRAVLVQAKPEVCK